MEPDAQKGGFSVILPLHGRGLGGGGCVGRVRRTGKKKSFLCSREGG